MKILIAAIHFPVASGRYLARAFHRLGHEVRTIGESSGPSIWGIEVNPIWNWEPKPPEEGWLPDLAINCYHDFVLSGRLGDCPKIVVGVDNHVQAYDFPGVNFAAYFLSHSWGMKMGEPNVYWLPAGYDKDAFFDMGMPRPVDVATIGVPYDNRQEIVQAMIDAGLQVFAGFGILWGAYNIVYNQAKIALVRSACGDVPMRFFENAAQGCCILTDRQADLDKLGFVAGVDYWPYDDPAGAVREAKYLLESGRWAEIAANGKRKVTAGRHTWDDRAQTILDIMDLAQEKATMPEIHERYLSNSDTVSLENFVKEYGPRRPTTDDY